MSEELKQLTELSENCWKAAKDCVRTAQYSLPRTAWGNYDALWVRDLGYMAEYCGDLMGAKALEACIEFVLTGQREDGWFPDRVESSGEPVYAAGGKRRAGRGRQTWTIPLPGVCRVQLSAASGGGSLW